MKKANRLKNKNEELLSRRKLIKRAGALGGLLLAGCDTQYYKPPVVRDGLMGVADIMTMASQRMLMSNEQLVQEHDSSEITKNFPVWNQSNPEDEEYQQLRAENYRDWRLPVTGLVNKPISMSLSDLKRLPRRTQTTMHICEQGWSAIAQWAGYQCSSSRGLPGPAGRWFFQIPTGR